MTIPATMSTTLNNVSVQELLDYADFTSGLVDKLKAEFAKLNGENATEAGVAAMLGKLTTDKVVTESKLTAETAKLANKDASDIDIVQLSTKLTTDGKSTIKTALDGKASASDLANKANTSDLATKANVSDLANKADKAALDGFAKLDGSNIDVGKFSGKLTTESASTIKTALDGKASASDLANKANTSDLANKADASDLANKADKAALNDFARLNGSNIATSVDKGKALAEAILGVKVADGDSKTVVETQLSDQFDSKADVDLLKSYTTVTGSNMDAEFLLKLGNLFVGLRGENIKGSEFLTKLESKFVELDGSNATDTGVAAMLGKLTTDKVVTESKLTAETAKLANKDASNIDVVPFSTKLTTESTSTIKTALEGKANTADLTKKADSDALKEFARLDGSNAEQGAALLNAILNVKSSTDPKQTILETRLAKADTVDVGQFVKIDGGNITTSSDHGKALAEAILGVKVADGDSKTVIETQLDAAFQLKADKTELAKKADSNALKEFAKLDGENIDVDKFLGKLSGKNGFVKLDGTNVTTPEDKGAGLAKAIFSVKDSPNTQTILVSELAGEFAKLNGTTTKLVEASNPTDTLPDAWANLI